jgi:hypothetical protein
MDLLKCQAIYNGNIENVVHTANLDNGNIVGLGVVSTDFTGGQTYEASAPATAVLATEEYLLIYQDEYDYSNGVTDVSAFVNVKDVPFKAYHLSNGDKIKLAKTKFTGTSVVGKYLIPANGTFILAVADDLTGGTRLALKITSISETIGYDKDPAVKAEVVSC